jgi:hypothetical protein
VLYIYIYIYIYIYVQISSHRNKISTIYNHVWMNEIKRSTCSQISSIKFIHKNTNCDWKYLYHSFISTFLKLIIICLTMAKYTALIKIIVCNI